MSLSSRFLKLILISQSCWMTRLSWFHLWQGLEVEHLEHFYLLQIVFTRLFCYQNSRLIFFLILRDVPLLSFPSKQTHLWLLVFNKNTGILECLLDTNILTSVKSNFFYSLAHNNCINIVKDSISVLHKIISLQVFFAKWRETCFF